MSTLLKQNTWELRQRPHNRRLAIVQAALKLFAAGGIRDTSVPAIASAANVAVGTLYCHFSSKESLANYLVCESSQAFCKYLWDGFPFDTGFRQQFSFFWRRYLGFALEYPEIHIFLHQRTKDLNLDETSQNALTTLEETENWIIDRGLTTDEFTLLPKPALSAILHGTAKALLQAHFQEQLRLDEITISQMEECCWRALNSE